METRLETCARCGAQIDPETGACPYCLPPQDKRQPPVGPAGGEAAAASRQPPQATTAAQRSTAPPTAAEEGAPPKAEERATERHAGPIQFEAEECLARGDAKRALVLASKALKEQPENLTVRALYDRARKAILRGQRGERLESRVHEARDLVERGDLAGAERIVVSALKLVPNHAAALELFALIKERRLAVPTAEVEAERDLERITSLQAVQFLRRAQTLAAQGSARTAFGAARRGLRVVPDHKELLALYGQLEESLAEAAARRAAFHRRVQEAHVHLQHREVERSRDILRAVLREDPDYAPAQDAMRAVRAVHLDRQSRARAQAVVTPIPSAKPEPAAAAGERPSPRVTAATASRAVATATAPAASPTMPLAGRALRPRAAPPAPSPAGIPPEVLLPRTRRRATPLGLIVVGSAVTLGMALFFAYRGLAPRAATGPRSRAAIESPPSVNAPQPLDAADPALRIAVERALDAYVAALERGDAEALRAARPDLSGPTRAARLAALRGALNVAVDVRVLEIEAVSPDARAVRIQRTDVVVGGPAADAQPVEERLRFVRRGGAWTLE